MKRKVMLITPSLLSGGAEKLVYNLAFHLDKETFDAFVILINNIDSFDRINRLKSHGVNVISLSNNSKPRIPIVNSIKIGRIIRKIAPDVIHTHLDTILYVFPFVNRKTINLHTIHSMADFEASGWRRMIRKWLFKSGLFMPVAIGENVKKSISSIYKINEDSIYVIENGVELCKKEVIKHRHKDEFRFITVGSISNTKNQILIIKVVSKLINIKKKSVSVFFIGDGPLRKKYEETTRNLNISTNVHFLGLTDNVMSELEKADAYICSSVTEGISLSIVEAMSCGLPIIASNVGGNPELVFNNINGFLFQNNDENDLQQAMENLMDFNEEKYNEFSCQSILLSQKYDLKKCVLEYERLYKKT